MRVANFKILQGSFRKDSLKITALATIGNTVFLCSCSQEKSRKLVDEAFGLKIYLKLALPFKKHKFLDCRRILMVCSLYLWSMNVNLYYFFPFFLLCVHFPFVFLFLLLCEPLLESTRERERNLAHLVCYPVSHTGLTSLAIKGPWMNMNGRQNCPRTGSQSFKAQDTVIRSG